MTNYKDALMEKLVKGGVFKTVRYKGKLGYHLTEPALRQISESVADAFYRCQSEGTDVIFHVGILHTLLTFYRELPEKELIDSGDLIGYVLEKNGSKDFILNELNTAKVIGYG